MEAILGVVHTFVSSIGPYEAPSIFSSRRRFLKLLSARDESGAVTEMERSLRQLHKRYLSRLP